MAADHPQGDRCIGSYANVTTVCYLCERISRHPYNYRAPERCAGIASCTPTLQHRQDQRYARSTWCCMSPAGPAMVNFRIRALGVPRAEFGTIV
eukprot:SAG31_NODE_7259_length_1740_cov_2.501523_1_plen_94_part_00